MKKSILTGALLYFAFSLSAQFKPLDTNDTSAYEKIDKLLEIEQFGSNYINKNVIISGKFWKIDNGHIPEIPEVFLASSREGNRMTYDSKKAEEFVGFSFKKYVTKSFLDNDYFYLNYGLQSEILSALKKLNENDRVVIFGKIVRSGQSGNNYFIKVKHIYTLDEYNDASTTKFTYYESFIDKVLDTNILLFTFVIIGTILFLIVAEVVKNLNKES